MSFPVPLPSTFMPLPLAIMIPFMGIQSGVMAQQFGMNFQYGKRKISAMSNEEFNKLTPQQMQVDFSTMIEGMIPTFEKSLRDMRPFQRMIFIEMIAAFKEAVDLGIDIAKGVVGVPPTGTPDIDPHKFLSPKEIEEHKKHGHLGGVEVPSTPKKPSKAEQKVIDGIAIDSAMCEVFKANERTLGSFPGGHGTQSQRMARKLAAKKALIHSKMQRVTDLQNRFKAKYGYYYAITKVNPGDCK